MPSRTLPGIGLTGFWDLGASYKTGMDTNLQTLSALVQPSVISRTTSLPGTPAAGARYLVPSGDANGDSIAVWDGPSGSEAWVYLTPAVGWRVYVEDQGYDVRWDGSAWQPVQEGGAASLSEQSDVNIVPGALTAAMVGRPVGLTGVSPVEFGLLNELLAQPVSGGVEVIAVNDYSVNPGTDLVLTNTHLYDEIVLVGYGLVGGTSSSIQIRPDGINPASWSLSRMRVYDTAGAMTAASGVAVGSDIFMGSNWGDGLHFVATIKGTRAGRPLVAERTLGTAVPAYFHSETVVGQSAAEVQALAFLASTQITAGVIYAVGIKNSAQPLLAPFDYAGSPAGAGTLSRFILPMAATIRAGAQGSFQVGANPTGAADVEIHQNGSLIGTITIPATAGNPTVSISADTILAAGDLIELHAVSAADFTDLFGSLLLEGRG